MVVLGGGWICEPVWGVTTMGVVWLLSMAASLCHTLYPDTLVLSSSSQPWLCAAEAPRLAGCLLVGGPSKESCSRGSELTVERRAIDGGLWALAVDPAVPLQAECGL